jgi:hypothetical protein
MKSDVTIITGPPTPSPTEQFVKKATTFEKEQRLISKNARDVLIVRQGIDAQIMDAAMTIQRLGRELNSSPTVKEIQRLKKDMRRLGQERSMIQFILDRRIESEFDGS